MDDLGVAAVPLAGVWGGAVEPRAALGPLVAAGGVVNWLVHWRPPPSAGELPRAHPSGLWPSGLLLLLARPSSPPVALPDTRQ